MVDIHRSAIYWSATPLLGVPQWTEQQAYAGHGACGSCRHVTTLRDAPIAGQAVCRPCWESMMFGSDDED